MFLGKTGPALRRAYQTAVSKADIAKRSAAYEAVNQCLNSSALNRRVVGLGSGTTIEFAIERIKQRKELHDLIFIPTSFQTQQLILKNKLRLGSLNEHPVVDLTIDGADEVDPKLNAIKGGGACLFQEMLVARASERFILIADERKQSRQLGTQWTRGIPVEVMPMALTTVTRQLKSVLPSDATVKLRMATPTDKAGPVVTDNGNFILDCQTTIHDPALLYKEMKLLTGVLEVGLFCNMAEAAYFGSLDSDSVEVWKAQKKRC
ncbi:ribose-5-phosphate isomerase [Radiomyces spectabilis]|uniref:ribose-5-phosphate isomerase n=1 Tax=Radiomyces spectabilis TaxID=64574 RepID=UPI0022207139|nr:ribose-5-phosphate isomerase [Radiomyces spectabilis]KAI8381449.1 ribose-5-phosphate isomerase [Radiomyces spectabilis]